MMSGEKKLKFDDSDDAMLMRKYLRLQCEDIARERDRVGGDWAVASAVPALLDREWRRHIRSVSEHCQPARNEEIQGVPKKTPGYV